MKTKVVPEYPNDFSNKLGSFVIPEDRIQEYIEDLAQENPKPGEFRYISSGDTIVLRLEKEDETRYIVARNYEEYVDLH